MKTFTLFLRFALVALIGQAQINTPSGAAVPFGTNTTYPGHYVLPSNLPSGGQFGTSQDAADAYNAWKSTYVDDCGGGRMRVRYDSPNQTVSEGIGYGMLLAAYAADKALFDGLYSYYLQFADSNGLMNWRIDGCTSVSGTGSATDADLDATMALIVASKQWGNATPTFNYQQEAWAMIQALQLWGLQPQGSPGPFQTNNGDQWGFSNTCRNPSYQSPAYYRAIEMYVPWQPLQWSLARTASYTLLQANADPNTGLVSNWCDENGTPNSCNGPDEYGWDACRHPWRMAVAAAWYADSEAVQMCADIADFVATTGVANLKGPLPQAGGTGAYHSPAFVSTWSAAVVGTTPASQSLLNQCYTETVNVVDNPPYYFGNTLRVLSLFLMTGNFWLPDFTPTGVEAPPQANNWTVFPNPGTGIFTLRGTGKGQATVIDMQGTQLHPTDLNGDTLLDLRTLAPGCYRLQVMDAEGSISGRTIVICR